ncbi:MAG: 2-oxoacid:acceptor oxidoreductase subunit alpha [Anaerolineales bacterium]|nr:2-oxoacid:acceptor oxidoreductase subunit alpha [Anaerolineales bacterium]
MTVSSIKTKSSQAEVTPRKPIVNDFSMVVATINGSGSQTSNIALIRALFRMGIPVSGKNLFPSNIQGLPTWFTIRANSDSFTARRDTTEILVAMNLATFAEDVENLAPGGVCFYSDEFVVPESREDVVFYPMPVRHLIKQVSPPKELRDYVANMVYVGVVTQVLGIEMDEIRGALETHFRGKQRPIELNMEMIEAAATWAKENLSKQDPYIVRREDKTSNSILMDGNTAGALGAIYGGLSFAAWYPITPASSFADALIEFLPQLRRDEESGKATYAIIQAEDELAAIGMAVGAGWSGARAMTSTSGPGISLMAEFAGLAFQAEIPVVIWNVQRMGPSTGLPTRTSQGDIIFVRFLGHGDTMQLILIPGTIEECFEFGWKAFDIAERFQTPVFVLSDLDLGMNLWMSEPLQYPDEPMDRGKVLDEEDLERLGEFARYRDVDGDGIPYRTLPGTDHPLAAYFTRGTGHDELANYSERPEIWEANMERLWRKLDTAQKVMPLPAIEKMDGAKVGLIAYGSTNPAIQEARARLAEKGIKTDYLRIKAVPFSDDIAGFIREHERIYVIEMNFTGQMQKLLQLEVPDQAEKIQSVCKNDGLPLSAGWVANTLYDAEGG